MSPEYPRRRESNPFRPDPRRESSVTMRRSGWRRLGKKRFRYVDSRGSAITDEEQLERIAALAIPPAWTDVWISPNARARLQATGFDAAGRKQYRYHDAFRAAQERAKYERLLDFGRGLPQLRRRTAQDLRLGPYEHLRDRDRGREQDVVPRRVGATRAQCENVRGHDPAQAPCLRLG
jgi:DNA topoisomerase IB